VFLLLKYGEKKFKNPIIIGCCIKVFLSPWSIYGQFSTL
jgi:hypothetical protein